MSLTHLDSAGAPRMVDVSTKTPSVRAATAQGTLRTTAGVVAKISADGLAKGDALAVARIAGIMAAKRVGELIPLCHPIAVHAVDVAFAVEHDTITITATVRTADRTGVEMEALTAVSVAGLTLFDMVKAVDPAAELHQIRVLSKTGGKSGDWVRPDAGPR